MLQQRKETRLKNS